MKFLIVDDHPLFREALRNVLVRLDSGAECLEAGSCSDAEAIIRQATDIELALIDNVMPCPDGSGVQFIGRLTERYPELPVVMLSASEDRRDMQLALDHGALGFIPKSLPTQVMVRALQLVLSGGIYVPTQMVGGVGDRPQQQSPPPPETTGAQGEVSLSPRQREIAELLCAGYSNKEIGRELGLSPETVKAHLAAIYRTLGVNNRTLAVVELGRLGVSSK